MPRNLDHRIEVVMPVEDTQVRNELESIFKALLADNSQAWELQPDGDVEARFAEEERAAPVCAGRFHAPPRTRTAARPLALTPRRRVGSSPCPANGRGHRCRLEHRPPRRRARRRADPVSPREMLHLGADVELHGSIPPEKLAAAARLVGSYAAAARVDGSRRARSPDHEPRPAGGERRRAPRSDLAAAAGCPTRILSAAEEAQLGFVGALEVAAPPARRARRSRRRRRRLGAGRRRDASRRPRVAALDRPRLAAPDQQAARRRPARARGDRRRPRRGGGLPRRLRPSRASPGACRRRQRPRAEAHRRGKARRRQSSNTPSPSSLSCPPPRSCGASRSTPTAWARSPPVRRSWPSSSHAWRRRCGWSAAGCAKVRCSSSATGAPRPEDVEQLELGAEHEDGALLPLRRLGHDPVEAAVPAHDDILPGERAYERGPIVRPGAPRPAPPVHRSRARGRGRAVRPSRRSAGRGSSGSLGRRTRRVARRARPRRAAHARRVVAPGRRPPTPSGHPPRRGARAAAASAELPSRRAGAPRRARPDRGAAARPA